MKRIKALILDVDGTLVAAKDDLPSEQVTQAIKKIQKEKQVKIILATARPFTQIKHIIKHLDLSGFAVVSGGAGIIDAKTGKPYQEHYLSDKQIKTIYQIINGVDEEINLWIQDNGINYPYTKTYLPDKPFVIVVHQISEQQAHEIVKQLGTVPGIFCTKTVPYQQNAVDLNITHEKGTKQKAIETVLNLLQIGKNETIGVGDGYNDLPIFSATGIRVAIGNAVDEIKKQADYIAPTVDEDGVAAVIKKYFV